MPTDKQIEAAMRHLDQRAEGGRCAEMVREMLEAAERAAWKPIETAPRDGTVIWVWNGEQARMRWEATADWSGWVYDDDLLNDVDPEPVPPDYWRPLFAAPEASDAE